MLFIYNQCHDPTFNLALEEYALTQMEAELIILWRNSKSVIIGKNQNTVEEVDIDYAREHGIAVVRRLSGGGAVYHDLGNINYTIITRIRKGDFNAYEKFTAPVCAYLETLGINARLEGRNDLLIDGKKFSGNAQTVKNSRLMHHGCILFNANFDELGKTLKPKAKKIESKGIKSVSKRVTNICEHLSFPMTPEAFMEGLGDYFLMNTEGLSGYTLVPEETRSIRKLTEEKYSTWEWNFGQSPAYNWENSEYFPFGSVDVRLEIRQGIIQNIRIFGDFFGIQDTGELENFLKGVRHEREAIAGILDGIDPGRYINGITPDKLLDLLC